MGIALLLKRLPQMTTVKPFWFTVMGVFIFELPEGNLLIVGWGMDAQQSLLCCRDQNGHILAAGMLSPVLHRLGSSVQVGADKWAQKQLQTLLCLSASFCLNCCEHSWAHLASKVLLRAAIQITGNGEGVDAVFFSLCTASWQDRLWFLHVSPRCTNIHQWTYPCFPILESKWHITRNILGVVQCYQYLWDLLFGCLLASPQCLAFSPLVSPKKGKKAAPCARR